MIDTDICACAIFVFATCSCEAAFGRRVTEFASATLCVCSAVCTFVGFTNGTICAVGVIDTLMTELVTWIAVFAVGAICVCCTIRTGVVFTNFST